MAQIQAGTSYSTGMAVTAANLNAHVNNATLQEGCISAQASSPLVSGTDNILVSNGTALNKTTLASIVTPLGLFDKNQAQTLGQNVSFASGAILTLGQDPVSALQAVPKQYVDNGFLNRSTGGLVSGSISMIGTSSILTLSADPVQPLEAAPKQYVENWGAREVVSLQMQTTTAPGTNNTVNQVRYIPATVSQASGSFSVTVSVANAALFNVDQPFFLAGQYIGLSTPISTLPARIYKIDSVNYAANTFTITAPDPTAKAGNTNISIVYSNLTPPTLPSMLDANGNKNIKSVVLCLASNKYYINYWYDTETGLTTGAPTTPATLGAMTVVGDAITGNTTNTSQFLTALKMRQFASAALTLPYAAAQPTGFDLTSKGAHIGFFQATTTGCPFAWIHDCNVLILR